MYVIKNAIANLGRNKGRNIIIGFIMLIIIFSIAISITITTSTKSTINYYKDQFGAEVVLAVNRNKLPTNINDYKVPKITDLKNYSTSEYIKNYTIRAVTVASLLNIKGLDQDKNTGSGVVDETPGKPTNTPPVNSFIYATNQKTVSEEFEKGLRKIIKGRLYEKNNEVIISEKLAELNQLSLGDTITIQVTSPYDETKTKSLEVTIVGIYEDHAPEKDHIEFQSALTNRANEVFMSLETAESSGLFDIDSEATGTFTMKNPEDLDAFKTELYKKGLPEYFELIVDQENYDKLVRPLVSLSTITNTFTIALLIFGAIVLVIISNLAIHERKYEIGVLRAIGMKKGTISFGLITEMVLIMVVCLGISLSLATVSSKPIANKLMVTQVEKAKEANSQHNDTFSQYAVKVPAVVVPIDQIDTQLSQDAIMKIILLSLLLTFLSSITGILYITRFEPMKILTERN